MPNVRRSDTINYLQVSHEGDDHQLVSLDRQGVIQMPINTLYSDYSLQTIVLKCVLTLPELNSLFKLGCYTGYNT